MLGTPLDPWEQWLVIHAGELLPDSRPRFRRVLVLVARQNGKTFLLKVLSLYWLFVERQPLLVGTHTTRSTAIDVWRETLTEAQDNPYLKPELGNLIQSTGREEFKTKYGCAYKVFATNRKTARGKTTHRLLMDEIREHRNAEAYNAAIPSMSAVPDAQAWFISNQGDDQSVVLNNMRDSAITFIETGKGDKRLGIFEWSAPNGSMPTDISALLAANPNIGYRIDIDNLLGEAESAQLTGGAVLADFRTETLCMRVHVMDPAIDPDAWIRCRHHTPPDLADHRDRVALCLDVSLDQSHATLVAAAVIDGLVHVEVVRAWDGYGCTKILRAELPDLVAKIKPRLVGWLPNGPAAGVAAALMEKKYDRNWPPKSVKVDEIKGELAAVCMGLADIVFAEELRHPDDPLLNQQIAAAQKLNRGDTFVYARQGSVPIDASYACAGAVHLARTLPAKRGPLQAA